MKWTVLATPEAVAREACERIVAAAGQAIRQRGEFHLVLAGGTTPAHTYALLAERHSDWANWHLWFGDERCLPVDDPGRNSRMVHTTLTGRVAIPDAQVHVMAAELGAERAARQYAEMLPQGLVFDMVLLGMGEDGHVASLFPGFSDAGHCNVMAVYDAPKPPAERVTMSLRLFRRCRQLLMLVTGQGKAAAVTQWRRGDRLPVSRVVAEGEMEVLLDKAACSDI